jgi:hypothetical protein
MTLVVHLPDELARRVEAAAVARGVSPEQVAVEAIEARLGAPGTSPQAPSFIGIGASGTSEPIGRRHRELIAERFAHKTAREV